MHEETKQQLLLENQESPDQQEFVELVSTPGYEFLPNITEQRFIKTHLPFSLLPPSVLEFKSKVKSGWGLHFYLSDVYSVHRYFTLKLKYRSVLQY